MRYFFFVMLLVVSLNAFSQDYVRLGNGNVVRGRVIENGSRVSLVVPDGDTLHFSNAQIVEVKTNAQPVLPDSSRRWEYVHYLDKDKGLWISTGISGLIVSVGEEYGFGCGLSFDIGYRFSDLFRIGVSVAPRVPYNLDSVGIQLPILLIARGNFFPDRFRMFAPYWGCTMGFTPNYGLTVSPEVGLRFGRPRSAFLLSTGYSYQREEGRERNLHFMELKIGYEF